VIPEEAIVPQGGKQFAIKLVNGTEPNSLVTQRVEVKIGLRSPGKVEVLEGLAVGETVVTAGQQRLQRDGTAVRVMDMAAPAARAVASAPTAAAPDTAAVASKAPAKADAKPTAASAGKAGPALPPLVGPDPCLAGVDEAAPRGGRPAAPGRKPVADGGPAALSALPPA
jgi:membrane fusion protein (multidrug efflux system)